MITFSYTVKCHVSISSESGKHELDVSLRIAAHHRGSGSSGLEVTGAAPAAAANFLSSLQLSV